jgi:hypothetical protein
MIRALQRCELTWGGRPLHVVPRDDIGIFAAKMHYNYYCQYLALTIPWNGLLQGVD